ncbi:class I SAM-dependent methyltransferase [Sediminicoccus sp. KRV36]|uniref:class I SAM-dependent methyltransferase n=1 Tax=Sediminicoccus sp. KRV36 TaxID=3133721 RepID=UPI00200BC52F|nr:class I SAM-dependent methyltransferase [Sediminicoccus rosea]UPY38019.1 class I SAM-dependent methyltransferase [Sediminicoccus rosea]
MPEGAKSEAAKSGEGGTASRLTDPRYKAISRPSRDAVALLRKLLRRRPAPIVAEIGVGIGATTRELARLLNHAGELHLFDYADVLATLLTELEQAGWRNAVAHPNGRKIFESYSWSLAQLLRGMRQSGQDGVFDFVYLDGAHSWGHDAPAALALVPLLRPGGVLLLDDHRWTFAQSPSLNPERHPPTAAQYSQEQIVTPHVALICEVFLDHDRRLKPLPLPPPADGGPPLRRAYRRRERALPGPIGGGTTP